ncbi:unnamed protein product [Orchesella dallaii]|uniref:WW domain-containing protein n=1 Tax=Orchesella dallaii TaxID=48710 RepID=A0ABP1Q0M7_9HEXA
MMEAFGLGPLPQGWECKIEQKTGRLYFINHSAKTTTWDDPRLNLIPPPPYHIAVSQPSTYFEDAGGSRWSSPVPSLRGFTLHRRGSSPRLGGSPRIAPLERDLGNLKNHRNEQLILGVSGVHSSGASTAPKQQQQSYHSQQQQQSSFHSQQQQQSHQHHHHELDTCIPSSSSPQPGPSTFLGSSNKITSSQVETTNEMPLFERPLSARSYGSSVYSGVPASFLSNCDPDTAFRAVCDLFPTADQPHIRHLFHKYHNRATLVVSALQVEKHPFVNDIAQQMQLSEISPKKDGDTDTITSICGDSKSIGVSSPFKVNSYTTGSPARTGTPISLLKFSNNQSSLGSLHTRWGSPLLSMSPQLQMVKEEGKLTKSPKMKLKYMKGIFPAADETFLLDVLTSCENNVQKASEKMLRKGFTRTPPPKPARQKWLEVKTLIEKRQRAIDQQRMGLVLDTVGGIESPFPTPVMKPARPHLSVKEKADVKARLLSKFPNLPERFVEWALEVAMYEVGKTERLLKEVGPQTPDEFKPFVVAAASTATNNEAAPRSKQETHQQQQRRIRFADGLTTSEFDSTMYDSNAIDRLAITAGFQALGDIVDTPDSGYFELDTKSRKKNFISSLFGIKYEKDKSFVPTSQNARGPNSALARGPNPSFVQSNYIPTLGPSSMSKGPNPNLRQGSGGTAQGANPSLAKGSIWSRKPHSTEQVAMHHVAVEG